MRTTMCKAKLVLETIKNTKGRGGMTPAQLQLAEAQSEDYQEMKKELREIKTDMVSLKGSMGDLQKEQGYIRGQVDILVNKNNRGFYELTIELIRTKSFWALAIIISTLCLCGKYNISPKDVVGVIKGLFGG